MAIPENDPLWEEPVALRAEDRISRNACAIHGVCSRNAVTGQVNLKKANLFPDFAVVDLWTRPCLFGSPEQIATDKYIFKPDPLLYRTWMYHVCYQSPNEMALHPGENGILQYILSERVIDANLSAGRFCPILYYFPLTLTACLTCHIGLVVLSITISVLSLAIFILLNIPHWYYWCRPITVPLRLGLLVYMYWALPFGELLAEGQIGVLLGVLLSSIVIVIDFVLGDANMVVSFGLHCSYEVVRELPNRIFVCRRRGAAFGQDWHRRAKVHSDVSGCGEWAHDYHLIAEVRGIIVELQPMLVDDWKAAWEMVRETGRPINFIGLDIFNEWSPTYKEVSMSEADRMAEMFAKQADVDSSEPPSPKALRDRASEALIE